MPELGFGNFYERQNAAAKFSTATFLISQCVDGQSISRILYNGNHLSCLNVAAQVCATYPKGQRATSTLSYLVLLRVRFIKPNDYPFAGRLLPCLFILTEIFGGFLFCDTVFKITLTGRYPARCSVESGLSSSEKFLPRLPLLPVNVKNFTTIIFSCQFYFQIVYEIRRAENNFIKLNKIHAANKKTNCLQNIAPV